MDLIGASAPFAWTIKRHSVFGCLTTVSPFRSATISSARKSSDWKRLRERSAFAMTVNQPGLFSTYDTSHGLVGEFAAPKVF
jgi:hypothetical protein